MLDATFDLFWSSSVVPIRISHPVLNWQNCVRTSAERLTNFFLSKLEMWAKILVTTPYPGKESVSRSAEHILVCFPGRTVQKAWRNCCHLVINQWDCVRSSADCIVMGDMQNCSHFNMNNYDWIYIGRRAEPFSTKISSSDYCEDLH